MNAAMATEIAALGLNVSLWFPAFDPARYHEAAGCITGNYSDPVVMAEARGEGDGLFAGVLFLDEGVLGFVAKVHNRYIHRCMYTTR